MKEIDKYKKIWSYKAYRKVSPGQELVPLFLEISGAKKGTLIDLGCGTGKAGKKLSKKFDVTLLDFVDNCVEKSNKLPFIKQPLYDPIKGITKVRKLASEHPLHFDYGYCCDVMEHLPTEYVMMALKNIITHCDHAFFSICPNKDNFGGIIGHPLHMTVKPFTWWKERLAEVAEIVDARDLIRYCIFYVRRPGLENGRS